VEASTIYLRSSEGLFYDIVIKLMVEYRGVHYWSSYLLVFDDYDAKKDKRIYLSLIPCVATFGKYGKVYGR